MKKIVYSQKQEEILNKIYDLILNVSTKDYERNILIEAKNNIESGDNFGPHIGFIINSLRPFNMKKQLSVDVKKFFDEISSTSQGEKSGYFIMNILGH